MSSPPNTQPRRQSFTLPFPPYSSPIALAAAQTLRRGSMSGSTTTRPRADSNSSLSSSVTSSIPADDVPVEAFEDGNNSGDVRAMLERRMSLGGRLRDVRPRAGSMSSAGQPSPTITRGFWLDPSMKKRRESISTMPLPEHVEASPNSANLQRRASVNVVQHDPLQERILKGDFYMD